MLCGVCGGIADYFSIDDEAPSLDAIADDSDEKWQEFIDAIFDFGIVHRVYIKTLISNTKILSTTQTIKISYLLLKYWFPIID